MTLKINFLDNSTQYYASDMVRQFASLMQMNGVSSETELYVSETMPNSLAVNISAGSAWINGYFVTMDSDLELEIPLNTTDNAVTNKIYLIIDTTNKSANIAIDSGNSESGKLKLKLASVTMENTNTVVTESQISGRVGVVAHVSYDEFNELWTTVSQMYTGADPVQKAVECEQAESAITSTKVRCYVTGSDFAASFWVGTQAQYNALSSKSNSTFYFITE